MAYTALYRKFRPDTFDEVKGQDQVVTILKNQLRTGRVGHAYVFSGTRGTGKTTAAKIFARAVNCENLQDGNPCGECPACRRAKAGTALNIVEIDAASNNGVDNIRQLIEEVQYSPAEGKYKVYIIDEVHMLSQGAFNALLKTLEEPPSYVIFILATTEIQKIPVTILSRCQRYDFRRISLDTITDRLRDLMEREGNDCDEKALRFIARKADGSMRDSLSLLDQCISFYFGEKLTYERALEVLGAVDVDTYTELFGAIRRRDTGACLDMVDRLTSEGLDLTQFVTDFTWYFRNLLIVKATPDGAERIDAAEEQIGRMKEDAEAAGENELIRYIRIFSDLAVKMKYASQKRVELEIGLIRLCHPQMDVDLDSLTERIRALEDQLREGVVLQRAAADGAEAPSPAEPLMKRLPLAELERALPEDLQKVIGSWEAILGHIDDTPLRKFLEGAEPAADEGGHLVLVLKGSVDKKKMENPASLEALKDAIADVVEKQVDIRCMVREEISVGGELVDVSAMINKDIMEMRD